MINKIEQHNGIHKCRINCDFRANFSANRYFAIDRQGALLSFEVIDRNARGVRGFIGLGINIKQQESLQCV
jgi:hypothetical protein